MPNTSGGCLTKSGHISNSFRRYHKNAASYLKNGKTSKSAFNRKWSRLALVPASPSNAKPSLGQGKKHLATCIYHSLDFAEFSCFFSQEKDTECLALTPFRLTVNSRLNWYMLHPEPKNFCKKLKFICFKTLVQFKIFWTLAHKTCIQMTPSAHTQVW